MTIDGVDAIGDGCDIFDDQDERCQSAIWNGRDVNIPELNEESISVNIPSKLFQFPNETDPPFPHLVQQLDVEEDDENLSEFVIAPCIYGEQFILDVQHQAEILLCKSFFRKVWDGVKKAAKKTAELFKKAMQAIAHGTKKAAEKVEEFVKDHKKEILIASAVIAAVSGAFVVSGLLSGGAAAASATPKKKEDEKDDQSTPSSSPPADLPPLPDWVQGLFESTAPNLSPATASDSELENAKNEVHNAWETLNHLKALTEADLEHLRKEDPKFDPTKTAIETIFNAALTEAQRSELLKNPAYQQHWQQFIHSGHEKIDQAFSIIAAHKEAASIPPPIHAPSFSFANNFKLGMEIIGHAMIDPDRLDSNARLDVFLKNNNIETPIAHPGQTISEFMNKFKLGLETIGNGMIEPDLLSPNTPSDLFFKYPNAGSLDTSSKNDLSRSFKTAGFIQEGMKNTFINGILCKFEGSFGHANYLHNLSPGNLSVNGIYNHSNGPLDLGEAFFLNYKGISPMTQDLLIKEWTEFHKMNIDRPYAKILHSCHSQGAIHTVNALKRLPEEIRNRIIVIAIAPAEVVTRDLCYDSFNYASKKDVVPLGGQLAAYWQACNLGDEDRGEMWTKVAKMQSEIIWLDPHEGATGIDHDFQSPTYRDKIIQHLLDYHKRRGEYR